MSRPPSGDRDGILIQEVRSSQHAAGIRYFRFALARRRRGVDTPEVQMHSQDHQPEAIVFRPGRTPLGGLTLALMLLTALAGMSITGEAISSTSRAGERASRVTSAEFGVGAGREFVGCAMFALQPFRNPIATLALHTPPAPPSSESRAPNQADVVAGLRNLPPPMGA